MTVVALSTKDCDELDLLTQTLMNDQAAAAAARQATRSEQLSVPGLPWLPNKPGVWEARPGAASPLSTAVRAPTPVGVHRQFVDSRKPPVSYVPSTGSAEHPPESTASSKSDQGEETEKCAPMQEDFQSKKSKGETATDATVVKDKDQLRVVRRREGNRQAAQRFRQRRTETVARLEAEVLRLQGENAVNLAHVNQVTLAARKVIEENKELRAQYAMLQSTKGGLGSSGLHLASSQLSQPSSLLLLHQHQQQLQQQHQQQQQQLQLQPPLFHPHTLLFEPTALQKQQQAQRQQDSTAQQAIPSSSPSQHTVHHPQPQAYLPHPFTASLSSPVPQHIPYPLQGTEFTDERTDATNLRAFSLPNSVLESIWPQPQTGHQ